MLNSNGTNVKTYVGDDGLIHFTDWTGADSVLPFSKGSDVNSIRQRFTTQPKIDYYENTCFSFINPGFNTLTINSCGANYWWLYSTSSLTHIWSGSTGTQIGSRNSKTFNIAGKQYLLLLVSCSQNTNSGYSTCDFTMSL